MCRDFHQVLPQKDMFESVAYRFYLRQLFRFLSVFSNSFELDWARCSWPRGMMKVRMMSWAWEPRAVETCPWEGRRRAVLMPLGRFGGHCPGSSFTDRGRKAGGTSRVPTSLGKGTACPSCSFSHTLLWHVKKKKKKKKSRRGRVVWFRSFHLCGPSAVGGARRQQFV